MNQVRAVVAKEMREALPVWVIQMWLFGLLFLYCLASELVRVIGAAKVKAMLLDSNNRKIS